MTPGRYEFRRNLGKQRLIKTALEMGLCTDGEMIWAPGEVGEPVTLYEIDPYLLDRLAAIYEDDGHLVYDGGSKLWDEQFSNGSLGEQTIIYEEYLKRQAQGTEPRSNFKTRSGKQQGWSDDMEEFDFGELAEAGEQLQGFGHTDRSFGDLDGLDADPDWGGKPSTKTRRRPDPGMPTPSELARFVVVKREQ